ncbi:acyltransferase [Nocardia sp. NPDC127579]|uniref:acyltransferase family protein n=1 Tax=Nocardia sp. NPDC127579 TaxID=3345402 RepID=UPI0036416BF3
MAFHPLTARRLAAATPDTRDRYLDLLRVFSLATVVLGHWLMVVLIPGPGGVGVDNALAIMPALQPLTWVFQVMPLFFFVGGFAHAAALRRGPGYAGFVRGRAARLVLPTAVFVAVWLAVGLLLELTGFDSGLLRTATRLIGQPLWFVGVYLGIVALAPIMWAAHRRFGIAVPGALIAGVAGVDLIRFGLGHNGFGLVNVALVWLAVHQLGFCYADGRLNRRVAVALTLGGLVAVAALVTFGPYPLSMVGMPGAAVSNMSPPTAALLAHALWLIGAALLLRAPISRWLARPRVWFTVVAANGIAMTAFLWHLTALFLVSGLRLAIGGTTPPVGSAAWWWSRPLELALFALATAGLILIFRRADQPRLLGPAPMATGRAALGATLCLSGTLGISAAGFGGALAGRAAPLLMFEVTPLRCAALLATGILLLRLPLRRLDQNLGRGCIVEA